MLIVISPAKTLDYEREIPDYKGTVIRMPEEATELAEQLRAFSPEKLKKLMKISDALAQLNGERFVEWQWPFRQEAVRPALLAFKGEVYNGLDALTMEPGAMEYAQKSLRILSGLYGVLRPLDNIMPYRLEMGTKLTTRKGKDLYAFWGDKITSLLKADIQQEGHRYLLNLASKEYFSAIHTGKLEVPVVTPVFKDFKNGQYKILSFFAKKARGLMTRYVIENELTRPEELKAFNLDGYRYNSDMTVNDSELVFTRD
ncbi:peroxide stress protein YaaA [Geofilum rubicundum]|uniref:UPF0246 protein JCM15548_1968 n=1 Tax=Geofilum rubicundum JCM 15548 TaxID=1236989 RepID=A0A0E9LU51_9BACT|nr:peroxide stress protein YaaA [Geofilum rubicundum]GAO28833.1 YaaA protein [Geofilum rubicundum JCM 15548]